LKKCDLSVFLGNVQVKERISLWLDQGRLPHSLLITSPDGCGRGFLARTIAAAWLEDTNGLVARNQHPDCLTATGEGASGLIPIKQIREILFELHKSPVMTDGHRICLLDDVNRLTPNTANALLKILEEPPEGTVFILCARHAGNLIETIRSRSIIVTVNPLGVSECLDASKQIYPDYDPERLARLCQTYGGRLGLVRKTLEIPGRLEIYDHAGRFTESALRGDKLDAMAAMDPYASLKTREDFKQLLFISSLMLLEHPLSGTMASRATHLYDLIVDTISQVDRYINPKILAAWLATGLFA